jgi:peptidoglycan DL-endopeptidase LytF
MSTRSFVKKVAVPLGVAALLAACSGGGDKADSADTGGSTTPSTLYPEFIDPTATTTLPVGTGEAPVAPGAPTLPPPSTVAGGAAPGGAAPQPGQAVDTPGGSVQASGVFYVVQSGDSLRSIARKFGTSSDALLALNQLADADLIQVGQRLQLPTSAVGGVASAGVEISSIYVIEEGDTIGKIAKKFGVSKEALIAANPGIDPNLIRVGAKLAIPAGGKAAPAPAAPAAAPAPAPAPVEPAPTAPPAPAAPVDTVATGA